MSHAGAGWEASFPHAVVGSYLPDGRLAVMVVGAGREPDPAPCAAALRAALRDSGRAGVVMDAAALGDVAGLADQEIVKRAAAFPVRIVVVVRVFPGQDGAETAVVTLYSRRGNALAAFSTARGAAVQPSETDSRQGVSREATVAVSRVLETERPRQRAPTPAEREYLRRALVVDYATIERLCRSGDAGWSGPARGNPPHPLTLGEFFTAVGRPDYAARALTRARVKTVLVIVGAGFAVAGAATASVGYFAHRSDPDWSLVGAGGAALGAGLVGLLAGIFVESSPVPAAEVYRLALDHNRKLREELKLPAETGGSIPLSRRRLAAPRVAVAPAMVTGGAGVMCGGTF